MYEEQRIEIVSRCLEILGGGHAMDSFIYGKNLNAEARVIRTRLDDFLKLPLNHYDSVDYGPRTSGRGDEYFNHLIQVRQPRLQVIATAARKADLAVAKRVEERAQAQLREQQQKEKRRTELDRTVKEIRSNLDTTAAFIEEISAAKGAVRELSAIYDADDESVVNDFITIDAKDTQDSKGQVSLTIKENPDEVNRVAKAIADLEQQLELKPENANAVRDQLSALRVRQRILNELHQALSPLNSPIARRENSQKAGFANLGKPLRVAAISASMFNSMSERRPGNRRWIGGANELDTRIQAIESPQREWSKPEDQYKPLRQIQEELEKATHNDDILTQEEVLQQLDRLIRARKSLAEHSAIEVRDTITGCIRNAASNMVSERLYQVLQKQRRINWSDQ